MFFFIQAWVELAAVLINEKMRHGEGRRQGSEETIVSLRHQTAGAAVALLLVYSTSKTSSVHTEPVYVAVKVRQLAAIG